MKKNEHVNSNPLIENVCVTFGEDSRSTARVLLGNLFSPIPVNWRHGSAAAQ